MTCYITFFVYITGVIITFDTDIKLFILVTITCNSSSVAAGNERMKHTLKLIEK